MYLDEGFTEENYEKLLTAAMDKEPEAMYELGMAWMYISQQMDDVDRREQGMQMLLDSAQAGYGAAATFIGTIYHEGKFKYEVDINKAVEWYHKGALLGDPLGMSNYGISLQRGDGGFQRDDEEAFKWISQAAETGLGIAQYNAALACHAGRGTRMDRVKAKRYFQLASQKGIELADMWLLSEDYKDSCS